MVFPEEDNKLITETSTDKPLKNHPKYTKSASCYYTPIKKTWKNNCRNLRVINGQSPLKNNKNAFKCNNKWKRNSNKIWMKNEIQKVFDHWAVFLKRNRS